VTSRRPRPARTRGLPASAWRPSTAVGGWQSQCLADPDHVREFWHDGNSIGIGCRAGGIVGLGLDVDSDGQDVLTARWPVAGHPYRTHTEQCSPSVKLGLLKCGCLRDSLIGG
jgi:hypothetical protein